MSNADLNAKVTVDESARLLVVETEFGEKWEVPIVLSIAREMIEVGGLPKAEI